MSSITPSHVHIIAESLGLRVKEEAAQALAPDVEYRLREIIQEGAKFMLHAKRTYLTTEDVNHALRLRNVEPLYSFGSSSDPVRFLRTAGYPDVFYAEDPELSIDQAASAQLPKCPVEVGVVPHWLAIDGVQPAIPENTPLVRTRVKRQKVGKPGAVAGATAGTVGAAGTAVGGSAVAAVQQAVVAKAAATGGGAAGAPGAAGAVAAAGGGAEEAAAAGGTSLVRAPVKHVVSQELQLYFDRVARLLRGAQPAAAAGGGEPLQRAVLASLACDPGLQPLAPYLVKVLSEGVGSQLKSLPQLALLLGASRALVMNPHLDLSPYLHQLMPALMTCLVAKRLGGSAAEAHWSIRDQAAGVVAAVCRRYSGDYANIAPRVQKTLLKALQDPSKPLTTHYGAVMGLAALGPRVVQLMLLPSLKPYMAGLAPKLAGPEQVQGPVQGGGMGVQGGPGAPSEGAARVAGALARQEALRVRGALLAAVASCVFRFMGSSPSPAAAAAARGGAAEPRQAHPAALAAGQQQGQQDGTAGRVAGAKPPAARQKQPLQHGRGRLALAVPPAEHSGPSAAQLPQQQHSRGSRAPSAAVQALFPPGDDAVEELAAASPAGAAPGQNGRLLAQRQHSPAVQQVERYAQLHAMRAADPAGTSSPALLASAGGGVDIEGLGEGDLSRNELAEAWREEFSPAVAAHAVYRIFGEGVLPYLPEGGTGLLL